jgi:predicted transcriptional regulator
MEKSFDRTDGVGLMQMTANVVSAYVANNVLPAHQLSDVISTVFSSLQSLGSGQPEARQEAARPAISVKKSITQDYLVCLEDGKKLKTLKRHLRTTYGMTPDDYRAKWGLGCTELRRPALGLCQGNRPRARCRQARPPLRQALNRTPLDGA